MKKTARWIKSDGTEEQVSPVNGRDFTLEECYKYVKTVDSNKHPMIQVVPLESQKGKILICEENAMSLGLPINAIATLETCTDVIQGPYGVQGDVLICNSEILE